MNFTRSSRLNTYTAAAFAVVAVTASATLVSTRLVGQSMNYEEPLQDLPPPVVETRKQNLFKDLAAGATLCPVEDETCNAFSFLRGKGIISGRSDGTAAPADTLNRAEITKFLGLAYYPSIQPSASQAFTDVPTNVENWYTGHVYRAVAAGFITGYPDGSFRPGAKIIRAEFMKMLGSAANTERNLPFTYLDVPADAYYAPFMGIEQKLKLFPDTTSIFFNPSKPVTRGEAAVALYRMMQASSPVVSTVQPTIPVVVAPVPSSIPAVSSVPSVLPVAPVAVASSSAPSVAALCTPTYSPYWWANHKTMYPSMAMATGLFDADTVPDVALVDRSSNSVKLLIGKPDFTYSMNLSNSLALRQNDSPISIRAADLNGDKLTDFIVGSYGAPTATIMNNGSYGYYTNLDSKLNQDKVVSLTTNDFNGDGKTDVAFVSQGRNVIPVYLGKGDGTFSFLSDVSKMFFHNTSNPNSIVSGDVNRDGKIDVVIADNDFKTLSLYVGKGDGTFTRFKSYSVPHPILSTTNDYHDGHQVFIADLNKDGNLDLVTLNYLAGLVSVMLGDGKGSFATPVQYTVGGHPYNMTIADLNADGNLDIALVQAAPESSILFGKGNGTFVVSSTVDLSMNSTIGVGDVDQDGKQDIITSLNGGMYIYKNTGTCGAQK